MTELQDKKERKAVLILEVIPQPWQDMIRALQAENERLRVAAQALHDDMLERARCKMDVIHGEEYRVVNAGNGAWMTFCAALEATK